jgi:tetratricopeptide (TPR) repeat protein
MLAGSALFVQVSNPDAMAQAQLGLEAAQKAKYHEAVEAYRRGIAIDPNLPGIYLNLGLAWFKLGKFQEAIAAADFHFFAFPVTFRVWADATRARQG